MKDGHVERRRTIMDDIGGLVREYFELEPPNTSTDCPMMIPTYGAEEVLGALDALLTQNVTMGRRVRAFEAAFAEYLGARHAVMVNSGSSANLLALAILGARTPAGLQPGDEVIVPAVTWSTTVSPILQLGCTPVFVDIDPLTLNMRTQDLDAAWSPETRAIFPVHLLGNPVDMAPLMKFAAEHELWVIEDSCEALGSRIGDRYVGTIGDMGTFSFFFSHHLTTIEGGMLVTDDDDLANIARSVRAHGWTRDMSDKREIELANPWIDPRFLFAHVGFNLRPMETQAAFGLVQLERLAGFNEIRRRNAQRLRASLDDLAGELDFVTEPEGCTSVWFGLSLMTGDRKIRERLADHLQQRGVDTRPIVAGNLTVQPAFRDSRHRTIGTLANASTIGERGLFMGNHPHLTDRQLDHIAESIHSFYRVR
jgi:CDP-4-dehydro-6-deoxyglucose reductase, E1